MDLKQRETAAVKLDEAIDEVAMRYRDLTAINASISGNRKFDVAETDRRVKDRLAFALADPVHRQSFLGPGRVSTTIAEAVRKDHEELAAKGGA